METTTKYEIGIDHDTADQIVICSLRDAIETSKRLMKKIKKQKKISKFDNLLLDEMREELDALEKVYDYYGGNCK